uniref:Uncharacterized protein n=1 Tax=Candidatus Kentrum sp. MB TaxID=2138164 RepID=A0A450WYJ2_9GAMM|nr:MAG: hypothetical protein BECKMB1821G_GA0114241_100138 [Candidatus Kentron sp. MB]VFK27699.1 MAG: hypothetical protein BECKMB1821I_GA0114274_100440 [Candidatus Kentron sp. MB]VFK74392.1 MAG: hypothetical protein BECKMB1821H_GA0114242_100440 [Candidatus Kentron sp. MB]
MLNRVPNGNIRYIDLTTEAEQLAGNYLSKGVVPLKRVTNAEYIAIATINHADVLVSWKYCQPGADTWL